jgi:hypothetical protein
MVIIIDPNVAVDAIVKWIELYHIEKEAMFVVLGNEWQKSHLQQLGKKVFYSTYESGPREQRWTIPDRFFHLLEIWEKSSEGHPTLSTWKATYNISLAKLFATRVLDWTYFVAVGKIFLSALNEDSLKSAICTQKVAVLSESKASGFGELVAHCLKNNEICVRINETYTANGNSTRSLSQKKIGDFIGFGIQLSQLLLILARNNNRTMVVSHRQLEPILQSAPHRFIDSLTLVRLASRLQKMPWFRCSLSDGIKAQLLEVGEQMGFKIEEKIAISVTIDAELPRLEAEMAEVHALLHLLDLIRPSYLVAASWTGTLQHSLRIWSKRHRIGFGVVQHGFNLGSRLSKTTATIDADIFYCWSKAYKESWISEEKNSNVQVIPMGNPWFDVEKLSNSNTSAPQNSPRKKRVLIAPSGFWVCFLDAWIEFWDTWLKLIKDPELEQIEWEIRLHFYSPLKESIAQKMKATNVRWSYVEKESIYDCISNADLVVTNVSSAVLDCISIDRLVLVWDNLFQPESEYFIKEECCPVVRTADEMQNLMKKMLFSPVDQMFWLQKQKRFFATFPKHNIISDYKNDFQQRAGSFSCSKT